MTSKYGLLARFLEQSDLDMLRMTFEEIEDKIQDKLPPAAREHRAWWANSETHSHARYGWMQAGYETSNVDMEAQELVFLHRPEPRREFLAAEMASPKRMAAPHPTRPRRRGEIENLARDAGGVDNLTQIVRAIQQYIDGDLLETELGRILRKLWPRR